MDTEIKNENEESIENSQVESKEEFNTKSDSKEKHYEKSEGKKKKYIIAAIIIIILLGICSTIFSVLNINNRNIISGVKINNTKVQGLTKEQAMQVIDSDAQLKENIKIIIDNKEYTIDKDNISVTYDTEKAVEEAYNIGRKSNIFVNNFQIAKSMLFGYNVESYIDVNDEILEEELQRVISEIPGAIQESKYEIDGETLKITKGVPGKTINVEQAKAEIKEKISTNNQKQLSFTTYMGEPKDIDIEKIKKEIYQEPKDAYYEENPFTVHKEENGIDLDIEQAKKILAEDKDEYEIPLIITIPQVTMSKIGTQAFPNLLGSCTTKYDASNRSRSSNLALAASTINEMVLQPGETFSYNQALGPRTAAKGYKAAGGYSGGKVVDMIGGGICQISSTLYDAAVYANLEIVERHNHCFTTAYIAPSKDATVNYGTCDLKFKNTRKNPVMIKASAQNGIATIEIYGIKEDVEYEIEIESKVLGYTGFRTIYEDDPTKPIGYEKTTQGGMRGCRSEAYKIYKLNGVEVSRELLSRDTYDPMNKYVTRGTQGEGTQEQEEVQPQTPENPTQPETPSEPTEPTGPTEPTVPETPSEPTEPTIPTVPETPETPQEPETPTEPEEP